MELQKRKALNIVFNRATNDGDICQTPEKAKRELETLNLSELAKNIQEKELESKEFFRCAYPSKVSVASQTLQNKFWQVDPVRKEHSKNSAQGWNYHAYRLHTRRKGYKWHRQT